MLQYRTTALTYTNTGRRFHYALQGFSQDLFYFGQDLTASGALYDPALAPYISRDLAEAVQSQRGGTVFGISMKVVMPPATAAAEPCAISSL